MIATFLRSSMIGSYNLCAHKFMLEYSLGIRQKPNIAATKGSIIHSVMEILAQSKLAIQNNQQSFINEQLGQLNVVDIQPFYILSEIFSVYKRETPELNLNDEVYKECSDLLRKALTFNAGQYDPRNLDIFAIEHPFDITINKPWAHYKFDTPGGVLEGQLILKGTIDLIIRHDDGTLEIRDYKTGRAWNWAKNIEKNDVNLYEDFQLILYYYCSAYAFPDIDSILFSIYFIRSDQPFLITFDRSDLPKLENIIRSKYEKIVQDVRPKLLSWDRTDFRCRFCPFQNDNYRDSGVSTCEYFRDKVRTVGYDRMMAEDANFSTISSYGFGGSHGFRE